MLQTVKDVVAFKMFHEITSYDVLHDFTEYTVNEIGLKTKHYHPWTTNTRNRKNTIRLETCKRLSSI
jgi:hypothetical protein